MSRSSIYSVGVDLGGTWVRLAAVNAQGQVVRKLQANAPALGHLPDFLKKKLHAWKVHPRHLIVASRGVWTPPERNHLKHALRTLAHRVTVMSDVEAAWHAAFNAYRAPYTVHREPIRRYRSTDHGPRPTGIVVIAGTGSIAWGCDQHGCSRRAGGWGPLLGDEGSAFWIGKNWLKRTHGHDASAHVLKLVRTPHHAVRRIAALVPRILKQAQHGDRLSTRIVQEAQQSLAELVLETTRHLHFKHAVPVSWGGSVLNNGRFREGFIRALQRMGKKHRLTFKMTIPGHSPVTAVARLWTSSPRRRGSMNV